MGNKIENKLNDIYTMTEAAHLWKVTEGAIRCAIASNRLIEGVDYRKSRRIVLITKEAMIKLYGNRED